MQAVATDHTEEMNKPQKRLTITGVVRRVTEEEEPYVQCLWYDRFWWDEEVDGEEEEILTGEEEVINETEKDKSVRNRLKVVNGGPSSSKLGEGKSPPSGGTRRTMSNSVRGSTGVSSSTDAGTQVGSVTEGSEVNQVGEMLEGVSVEGGESEWVEDRSSWHVGTTFYKLEMLSMQLDLNSGLQVRVSIVALVYFSKVSCP